MVVGDKNEERREEGGERRMEGGESKKDGVIQARNLANHRRRALARSHQCSRSRRCSSLVSWHPPVTSGGFHLPEGNPKL